MSSDSEVSDVERDERGGMAGDGFFWELVRRSTEVISIEVSRYRGVTYERLVLSWRT